MNLIRDVARDIANIYCPLSMAGIDALAHILVPTQYNKGDMVLSEGEVCRAMFYVHKGMVRQYYYKNKRDVTEHFSYEGRIAFCIESFLKQEPSRLMVEALEASELYEIPYEALHLQAMHNAEIARLYRKILEHALISSQEHADSQRFETAAERYERLRIGKPQIVRRAPLQYIASYLQMSAETLSRVRNSQ